MDPEKLNGSMVRIAVREAPIRITLRSNKIPIQQEKSVVEYPEQCANSLMVDGNVYCFDHVFNANVTQAALYDTLLRPLVAKVLGGYNCTALAYGQTGTGKSYSTGLGAEHLQEAHMGLAQRCLHNIFESIANAEGNENQPATRVNISFIEIYNEKVYDLLAPTSSTPIPCRGHKFVGGVRKLINNPQDMQQLLLMGTKNRHVRPTSMNANSSRSHAVLTIVVSSDVSVRRIARLNIVDLAGSEGLRRTGHEGLARSEGVHINQGLLCINKLLLSMSAGHRVLPYRDSVLTSVLQDSLSFHSHIVLLACISPLSSDLSETNSTLRFAKSAKQLKLTQQQTQLVAELKRSSMKTPYRAIAPAARNSHSTAFKMPTHSVAKKRPLVQRNHTFCSPSKRMTTTSIQHLLPRSHSAMELTPKAKERAQEKTAARESSSSLFDLSMAGGSLMSLNMSTSTALDASFNSVPVSRAEYTQLKAQLDAMTHAFNLMQQRQEQKPELAELTLTQAPPHSMLSYKSFTSSEQTISKARCQLFNNISPVDVSGIQAQLEESSSSSSSAAPPQPLPTRRSQRLQSIRDSGKPNWTRYSPGQQMRAGRSSSGHSMLSKHRASLLKLVNSASAKQLQLLPCVGPKSAIALVTHRTMLGSFKSWTHVQQLPIWRGSAWTRFAAANCLEL